LSQAPGGSIGGFTTVVCMPNTSPVADNPSTIADRDRAAAVACVNVYQPARFQNLAGEELAPIGSLAQAGVVAIRTTATVFKNSKHAARSNKRACLIFQK
jgi:dihydroorotase